MTTLVTGSSGHLGEALVRTLRAAGTRVVGADILASPFTTHVGSIADRGFVQDCMAGVGAVIHTATLHKPHVATHSKQDFVDTNVTGTLNLLEAAVAAEVGAFVYTSTTSAFGDALTPPPGAPAGWITEDVVGAPKNIYGATKTAAEDLCALFARNHGLGCVVLRTSRFFPEEDDSAEVRAGFADANAKANEFLYRRVDVADAVEAHLLAVARAREVGFEKFIISATTPFGEADRAALREDTAGVVARLAPGYAAEYARRGWRMVPSIDRVYVNAKARELLGWAPAYDFARVVAQLAADEPIGSELARQVGSKGYHAETFEVGPYPVG